MNLIEKVDHCIYIYIQLDVCYNWLKMVLKMAFKDTVQIVIHWWKWENIAEQLHHERMIIVLNSKVVNSVKIAISSNDVLWLERVKKNLIKGNSENRKKKYRGGERVCC